MKPLFSALFLCTVSSACVNTHVKDHAYPDTGSFVASSSAFVQQKHFFYITENLDGTITTTIVEPRRTTGILEGH